MGFMTIDGQRVEFTNEPNVLTVIRNAEIDIPTLCYHSELSIYGACRLCTVEDDRGKTFASCAEPPRDGMVIYTNTPRLMRYRRTILELLLAAHDRDCTTCVKSGECHLLELAHRMGVDRIRFKNREAKYPIDESSPAIVRNPNKCILCGDCVRMCDNVQSVNAIDFAYRGTSTLVTPAFNKTIAQTNCVNCGQCRVVCPTGAISIKTNIDEVWDALADPNTIVVAQVAPAVRVALGDKFGIPKGENVMGKLVNALHRLGFHGGALKQILLIGLPAGLQSTVFSLSNVVIQSAINSFGSTVVAGSSASSNLEGFVYTAMNAFAQAAVTFTSQNMGARKYHNLDRVMRNCLLCAVVTGILLGGGAALAGRQLLHFYSSDEAVIAAGYERLWIICGTYLLCGIMDTLASSLRGLGYSVLPMVVSLIGSCLLRLVWIATIFQLNRTPFMLYISYPISWVLTASVHLICLLVVRRKLQKKGQNLQAA